MPTGPYVWVIGAALGVVLTLVVRSRFAPLLRNEPRHQEAVRRFVSIFGVLFTVPAVLLGIIQVLGGYDDPIYAAPNLGAPYAFAGWLVCVLNYVGFLWWFWRGGGSQTVALLGKESNWLPTNPTMITLFVTIVCVAMIALLSIPAS